MFSIGRAILARRQKGLRWDNYVEIADALFAKYHQVDPLTLKFTELHDLVVKLEEFQDTPQNSSEGKLEKIQMEWLELFSEH